LVILGEAFF